MRRLLQTLNYIKADIKRHRGSTLTSFLYIYMFNPSFRLILNYRLGAYFYNSEYKILKIIANYYKHRQIIKRSCQISYSANIGTNIHFPHPIGIVIGDGVVIGNNVSIWQQVTLGSHGKKEEKKKYPLVGDNVKIYSGSIILGDVQIGECAIVAAGAVVTKNVPAHKVAVGVPALIK